MPTSRSSNPTRVGLTGGIACGKSLACQYFINLGIPVLDADEISRELTAHSKEVLQEIKEQLGSQYLLKEAGLNRKKLREDVFQNTTKRKLLESIIHPRVRQTIKNWNPNTHTGYVVIAIPLLFENDLESLVDQTLVIDCPEQLQMERVLTRDHISEEQARNIISAQISRAERLERADWVISNTNDKQQLEAQINDYHRKLSNKPL